MENYFINKCKHRFHRIGFYLCAVKYYIQNNYKKEFIVICLLKAIFINLKLFNYKYGFYEYLEIPITTRCTLKCKYCSNLIPCYNKPKDYDLGVLKKSINNFLKCINKIVYVRILGGEPFISKNLIPVLKELIKSDKIYHIEIVTNGTFIPVDNELIKLLKNDRICICISKYPIVDDNKLVSFLKENNIKYRIDKMKYWMDFGKPINYKRTEKELKKQYARCSNVCKSLVNGELHLCPRSGHGKELGIIKNTAGDYLDFLGDIENLEKKKQELNTLLKKKYINACNYCYYGTKKSKKIPVAEQLNNKK